MKEGEKKVKGCYEHARTSTTQPSRLQKFVRASLDIFVGSRPIQSTRDGS